MSFSKSKVERFPFNSNSRGIQTLISKGSKTPGAGILGRKTPGSTILKRSHLLSSPSTSMMSTSGSSFHSTPSKKDNFKPRRPINGESKISDSVGNKKSPAQRIPMLNRSHNRTVITKPKCSPVYRGKVLNMTGKTNQTTPGKRKLLLTSGSKKTPILKKKDSIPTPKRRKFDETSDDMYLTPLTSPPDSNTNTDESTDADASTIIFDPQSLSRCLEEAKKSKIIEDEDREACTPTALFESTRLDVNETPTRPPERVTEIQNGGGSTENQENLVKDVMISDEKEEESTTVTTPGRNPSRKSVTKQNVSFIELSSIANRSVGATSFTMDNLTFPDDEHTSRMSVSSRTRQSDGSGSFGFMNDAFLQQQQLSLQDSERNSQFFQSSSASANPQAVLWASDDLHLGLSLNDFPHDSRRPRAQSFSCYTNYDFPGHVQTAVEDEAEEPIPPAKPPSISSRIGSMISTIFPKKNKRDDMRSAAGLQIFAEHNYLDLQSVRDGYNLRRRPRRLGANSFIPVALREFIFREPPFQARFNREVLRRLARMLRIETLHTFREIRVSVILPAKMYVKSPDFWMPVVEFVAGQALEITLTSLRK